MSVGTVIWFDTVKCFGVITTEGDGRDRSVRYSAIFNRSNGPHLG